MAAGDVFLRGSQVVIRKEGGAAELVLENATKDVLGFLYNTGGGLTEFVEFVPGAAAWGTITGDITDQTDLMDEFATKQDTLVSGVNIKTINGVTILGSGDMVIGGAISDGDKGDITVSGSGATWTIDNTAVTFAKFQNISANRVMGRVLPGSGVATELTGADITPLLSVFTASTPGIVPLSGGGTSNYLRADGTWAAPSGGGGVSDGDKGDITVSSGGATWTIDLLAVGDSKISDVAWSKITGAPTIPTVDLVLADGSTNAISNNAVFDGLATKQATLVSGVNIKTINGNTILGAGDLVISGTIADGDKTDITVSGSGTVFTIDNLAVTNAKINDVAWTKITGVPDAAADGATKGVATFAANDFNAFTGLISIDYTNGQAATSSTKGFLTSANWTTFNAKQTLIAGTMTNGYVATVVAGVATWAASAASGGESLDATLAIGNTTGRVYVFDQAATGVEHIRRIEPLNYGTDFGTYSAYGFNETIGDFNVNASGRHNTVWMFGYNQAGSGGRINADDASYHWAIETHYESGGDLFEDHKQMTTQEGNVYRLESWTISKFNGTNSMYQTTNQWDLRLPASGTPIFMSCGDGQFELNSINTTSCTFEMTDQVDGTMTIQVDGQQTTMSQMLDLSLAPFRSTIMSKDLKFHNGTDAYTGGDVLFTLPGTENTDRKFVFYSPEQNLLMRMVDYAAGSQFETYTTYNYMAGLSDGTGVARMVTTTNGFLSYATIPGGGGGSGDMITTATNTMSSAGKIIFPYDGNESNLRVGSLNFQPYSFNATGAANNIYYDGTDYRYVEAGAGVLAYWSNGSWGIYTFPSGSAAAVATAAERLVVNNDGAVAFNGSYGTTGQVLQSNGSGAAPTWVTGGGGGTTETASNGLTKVTNDIQLGGTLAAGTTIDTSTFNLNVTGTSASNGSLNIANTGNGPALIVSSVNGIPAHFTYTFSTTSSSEGIFKLTRATTGTAANGIGGSMSFDVETSDGTNQTAGEIAAKWTTATTGSRSSVIEFYGANSAATDLLVSFAGNGEVTLHGYDAAVSGTAAFDLAVTSTGKIITVAAGGGGSGVTTLAAIGSTPNANAATISGTTLNMQPASGSFGGVMTTGIQTIAGNKDFIGKKNTFQTYFGPRLAAQLLPTEKTPASIADTKYNAFGTTAVMPSGKIIIIYKRGTSHTTGLEIGMRSSTDQGQTWSANSTIYTEPNSAYCAQGGGGGVTPSGRLIFFLFVSEPGTGTAGHGVDLSRRMILQYSDDEGATWTSQDMNTNSELAHAPYGPLVAIGNNELLLHWYGYSGTRTRVYVIKSTDDGVTWGSPIIVKEVTHASQQVNESSFCYLGGNTILGLIRTEHTSYLQSISNDNGVTWADVGTITAWGISGTPAWTQTFIAPNGKRAVVAYHRNGTDIKAIYGYAKDLIDNGISGWDVSTEVDIGTVSSGSSGYPQIHHPYEQAAGFGWYYSETTPLTVADFHFVSTPISTGIPLGGGASGITINNNANNRIITGSNTANTLEGESLFTFDGTTLAITNADSNGLKLRDYDTNYYAIWPYGLSDIGPSGADNNKYAFLFHKNGSETYIGSTSVIAMGINGAAADLAITSGLVTVTNLKITVGTPSVGWVWTCTNVDGSGEWAAATGGASQWTTIGSDIYFTGKVNIGEASAGTHQLEVRKDQNSGTYIKVENLNAHASTTAGFSAVSDGGILGMAMNSSATSAYGALLASEGYLYTTQNITLMTDASTSVVKIAVGGSAESLRFAKESSINYINFGGASGTADYGFRNNGGTMEFKNSGGSWAAFGGGGSTTINNNANDRVITGSGTANTLEAESSLTFNGATLTINAPAATDTAIVFQENSSIKWYAYNEASTDAFVFFSATAEGLRISQGGLVTIPTVKITGGSPGAGKLLTSDADGDATWETLTGTIKMGSITSQVGIANTETVVVYRTLGANTLQTGTCIKVKGFCSQSGTNAATPTIRVRIGTSTLSGAIAATLTGAVGTSAVPSHFEALVTIRTITSSGTAIGGITQFKSAVAVASNALTATVTVNSTVSNLCEFTFISGHASNTYNFQVCEMDVINPTTES